MHTRNNKLYIVGGVLLGVTVFSLLYFPVEDEENQRASLKAKDNSGENLKLDRKNTDNNRNWPKHLRDGINYLLAAFQENDPELLRHRVQDLLDEDWEKALEIFAELDYTFLHYRMQFPHEIVADHLAAFHSDPDVMEILSAYISQSSILASVMDIHFKKWMNRDHLEQFEWFKENTTFIDPRIMVSYVEEVGDSENGKEVTGLLGGLPDTDQRKQWVYPKAMEYLASEQPIEFSEYLRDLDSIPEYTAPAVYNLAIQLIRNEAADYPLETIQRASEWLDLVENKDQRLNFLAQAAAEFRYGYPDEFRAWLPSLTFDSEDERINFESEVDIVYSSIETANTEREQLERIPEDEQNLLSPFSE